MMFVFKKASRGKLVTVELELNTIVHILTYRISKDMDKCVVLARSRVFFLYYMEKKTVKECVLDILIKAIIGDLSFQKSG